MCLLFFSSKIALQQSILEWIQTTMELVVADTIDKISEEMIFDLGASNHHDCGLDYSCIITCIWCNINSFSIVLGGYNNCDVDISFYDVIGIPSVPL